MKTVIYARKSTSKFGQSETIENQIKICKRKAKELGLEIVDIKTDTASGSTDNNRDEVKDLIKGAIDGKYDCVLMKGISRFYRDVEHGLSLVKKLDRSNVRVVTVEENFDSHENRVNGQVDTSMLTIYLLFSENEVKKTSSRIKHTQLEKAHAGEWNQSASPPFGYKYNRETKKLDVDTTNSEVLKLIFKLYSEHMGMRSIAQYLNGVNEEGVIYPSPKGKQWSQYTIGFILKNRVYLGEVVYNKRSKTARPYKNPVAVGKTEDDVYYGVDYNDEKDWIITPNAHKPLISRELFDKVQDIINSKGVRKGVTSTTSLLAKVAVCGHCGKGMTFKRGNLDSNGRIKTKSNYYCSNYIKYGKINCTSHHVGADELDALILDNLKEHVESYLNFEKVTYGAKRKDNLNDTLLNKIKKIESEITNVTRKSDLLLEKNMDGKISDIQFDKMNQSYISELEILTNSLADTKIKLDSVANEEKSKDYIRKVYDEVINIHSYPKDKQRFIVMSLIEKIVVTDGDININYKFM